MEGRRRGPSIWAEPPPIRAFEPAEPIRHTDTSAFGEPKPNAATPAVHKEVVVDWQMPDAPAAPARPTSGSRSRQAVSR